MARRSLLLASLIALPLAASAAGFDTGDDGWTSINGGTQTWVATGGNGGGWLQIVDATDQDFLLNAPSSWLGNWSAYAGGTLSFDARNALGGESPDYAPFGIVTISNGSTSVTLDIAPANTPPADGLWHRYSVVLSPSAGWGSTLPGVLANVTSVTIEGEFHAGVTETIGIDNIQVTAVPEPASYALLLGGLALLASRQRKR